MAEVHLTRIGRSEDGRSLLDRIGELMDSSGVTAVVADGDLTAVKLHFGETGNSTFIRPVYVRRVVDRLVGAGSRPFLTDTNTLYPGSTRNDAVSHLLTARRHGFVPDVVGAPVIISGGLVGGDHVLVDVPGGRLGQVSIARTVREADSMVVVSHFKGHGWAGFGGAIKNIGMGCATPEGKRVQHRPSAPVIEANCVGCGRCADACTYGAIAISDGRAKIDHAICGGCGRCISACPNGAMHYRYEGMDEAMRNMAEYAYGAVSGKRVGYISLVMDVTPFCDCAGSSDPALVADVGILASMDPVAIDQASWDLVRGSWEREGNEGDPFSTRHPRTIADVALRHAERIGLGSRDYRLVEMP